MGGPLSASPALANGRIVIGSQDGRLVCFGSDEVRMRATSHADAVDEANDDEGYDGTGGY